MSTDLHTLSGAYVLHALSPDESREFCKHYEACPACQQEVAELRETAAKMGASEAVRPPAHLKARVLSAADKVSQLPPRVEEPAHEEVRQLADRSKRHTPKWFPRLLAAAAVVALIGGVGVSQLNQEPESNLAAGVSQVFEADDARTETLRTSNGGEISVATSPSLGKMAIDSDELPELDDDRVYQLWAITKDRIESQGVLEDPKEGAEMDMPSQGIAVAITIEPDGGSKQPTDEPIMSVVPSEV